MWKHCTVCQQNAQIHHILNVQAEEHHTIAGLVHAEEIGYMLLQLKVPASCKYVLAWTFKPAALTSAVSASHTHASHSNTASCPAAAAACNKECMVIAHWRG